MAERDAFIVQSITVLLHEIYKKKKHDSDNNIGTTEIMPFKSQWVRAIRLM